MWFDPLEKPMLFFAISCGLGYFQIMVGIFTALIHNLSRKDYIAAACDNLTWIIMINGIVLFGTSKVQRRSRKTELIKPSGQAQYAEASHTSG